VLPFRGARVAMDPGQLLRVMGPASIVVETGRIRVLGAEFGPGSSILVHRYRSYVVKALERAVLSVRLGEGGAIEKPNPGEEVVDAWERIAEEIASNGRFVAMVTGPVDSGKTSLATMIANVALGKGLRVAVVDIDVGQGDLSPPGFIALKYLEKPVTWLRLEKGDSLRFVGGITPVHNPYYTRLMVGAVDLVNEARERGCQAIVVNTGGWVTGINAVEMKIELAYAIRASHVVVLDEVLCKRIGSAIGSSIKVICAPRPKVVRERNRADRRELRRHQYMRFFQSAKRICVDLSSVVVIGSCALSGRKLCAEELPSEVAHVLSRVHASLYEHDDILVLWSRRDVPSDAISKLRAAMGREVFVVTPASAKGLLCAVLDENLRVASPGIIDSIDLDSGELCIYTEHSGRVGGVIIGRIKLGENWDEVARLPRCPL